MRVATAVPLPPLGDHELLVFWCQLVVILLSARMGGYLLRRLGQPRVVGELLAGVALGPSVFGAAWPDVWRWLFPDDDRQAGLLLGIAWFGIVLLLMTTGAETDVAGIRRRGSATATIAVGSLVVPLCCGTLLGWWLPDQFVGDAGGRGIFAVFMGIALAISSLPVAARILSDLGLLQHPVGQIVLTVAVTNDVIGWMLLGVLTGVAERGAVSIGDLAVAVSGMLLVTIVVLTVGDRFLDTVLGAVQRREGGPAASASLIVLFAVGVGAVTHAIGLEVVIGAFLAGIAIGRSRLATEPVLQHLDVVTSAVFAPVFFGVAGLRIDLRALDQAAVLIGAIVVIAVATFGKLLGAYAGARLGGFSRADSFGIGAALNARGALEVVVATVGLSIGVLTQASYTAIVLMAIVTSASAGPLLRISAARRL